MMQETKCSRGPTGLLAAATLLVCGFLGGQWYAGAGEEPANASGSATEVAATEVAAESAQRIAAAKAAASQFAPGASAPDASPILSEVAAPSSASTFKAPQREFLRLQESAGGEPVSLDVAVATYKPTDGSDVEVSLVSAIHIADKSYFETLNKELSHYDTVLYELIAPKNSKPEPEQNNSNNLLSMVQGSLSDILDVKHQLDEIDYHKPNFVHADLSMDELIKEGERRGETQLTLFAGVALDAIRMVQKAEQEAALKGGNPVSQKPKDDLLYLLSNPAILRREFAKTMVGGNMKSGIPGFDTLTPYLVDARNKAAVSVLSSELHRGRKRIAIFYGAAHMPDFEQRLLKDFSMQRVDTRWLTAWDMKRTLPQRSPLLMLLKALNASGAPGAVLSGQGTPGAGPTSTGTQASSTLHQTHKVK